METQVSGSLIYNNGGLSNYKMKKREPKTANHATAFTSDGEGNVIVFTDEGDEVPIKVEHYRVRALIQACLDALEGERNTY